MSNSGTSGQSYNENRSLPVSPSFLGQCPSDSAFSSSNRILSALQDAKKTEELISWLISDSDNEKANDNSPSFLSCPRRVTAAYCILNSIRDSCRDILEQQQQQHQQHIPTSPSITATRSSDNLNHSNGITRNSYNHSHHIKEMPISLSAYSKKSESSSSFSNTNYEESFPSLSSTSTSAISTPNILKTRKKGTTKKTNIINSSVLLTTTQKRRIRPVSATLAETNNTISSAVAASEKNASTPTGVNLLQDKVISPWNKISKSNLGKKDPMERIMNSKTIIGKEPSSRKSNNKIISSTNIGVAAAKTNVTQIEKQCFKNQQSQIDQSEKKIIANRPLSSSPSCVGKTKKENESNNRTSTVGKVFKSHDTNDGKSIDNNNDESSKRNHDENSDTAEYKINTTKSPPPPPSQESHHPELFQNIISVYFSIIKYQLIPSMILELQLILRLLCLEDDNPNYSNQKKKKKKKKKQNNSQPLSPTTTEYKMNQLFSSRHICQQFAIQILIKMKFMLTNLTQEILISLLQLKPVQCLLPKEIIKELHDSIQSKGNHESNSVSSDHHQHHGGMILGSMSKSTILNVSFNEKRDSRHHFRSKDLGTLYNNREQCRGEFCLKVLSLPNKH